MSWESFCRAMADHVNSDPVWHIQQASMLRQDADWLDIMWPGDSRAQEYRERALWHESEAQRPTITRQYWLDKAKDNPFHE